MGCFAVGKDDLVKAVGVTDFVGGESGREGQKLARFQSFDEVGALAHGGNTFEGPREADAAILGQSNPSMQGLQDIS